MEKESIYEKNMRAIEQHSKCIYDFLRNKAIHSENMIKKSVPAKDGTDILIIEKQRKQYYMNSRYAPLREAVSWASNFKVENIEDIYILYGFGNGILIREFLKHMQEGNMVIAYEPSLEVFLFVVQHFDISDVLTNKKFCLIIKGINNEGMYHILEYNVGNYFDEIKCLPYYKEIFEKEYFEFIGEYEKYQNEAKLMKNTLLYLSHAFNKNEIANLKYFIESKSFSNLKKLMPKNVPAILISAGPSLKESVLFLKKAKGKAVMIAVDRALDFLMDNEVIPDFIATIDPIKEPAKKIKEGNVEIPLLTLPGAANQFMENHKGSKYFINNGGLYGGLMQSVGVHEEMILSGESVANYIFSILIELGIKRIVLVGQDLAYGEDGSSHVQGTEETEAELIKTEGVRGKIVYTRYDWEKMRQTMEKMITLHPETDVIDVKQEGAKIHGAREMKSEEVLKHYFSKEIYFDERIRKGESVFNSEQREQLYEKIGELKTQAEEAVEILKIMIEKLEEKNGFFVSDMLNKKLEENQIMVFLNDAIIASTADLQRRLAKENDPQKIKKIMKEIYRKMLLVVQECLGELGKVRVGEKECEGEEIWN